MSRPTSEEARDCASRHGLNPCPECGAPEEVARSYVWLNSGVMVQSVNLSKRMGFIESDILDPLYREIGKILATPIEERVADVARRHTLDLYRNLIQPEVRNMLRNQVLDVRFIGNFMAGTGQLNGNGKYEILEVRFQGDENDYTLTTISEPFSLPFAAGINVGCSEVITEKPHKATYREISPDLYEIKVYVSEHDHSLEGCLPVKEYRHRDGGVELERCPSCGCPREISRFKWLPERGVIVNERTGRRLKIADPCVHDLLYEELEKEFGETVPATVVEAHKRFAREGFFSGDEIGGEEDFRTQLALRGMGNLREMKISRRAALVRVDNAADYLMMVGLAQGFFEAVYNLESRVEWRISPQGDLDLEIRPL